MVLIGFIACFYSSLSFNQIGALKT